MLSWYLYDDKVTVLCNTQDGHFDVDLKEVSSLKDQLVRLKGFEPPTFWFVAKHSIQLSYSRVSDGERGFPLTAKL